MTMALKLGTGAEQYAPMARDHRGVDLVGRVDPFHRAFLLARTRKAKSAIRNSFSYGDW